MVEGRWDQHKGIQPDRGTGCQFMLRTQCALEDSCGSKSCGGGAGRTWQIREATCAWSPPWELVLLPNSQEVPCASPGGTAAPSACLPGRCQGCQEDDLTVWPVWELWKQSLRFERWKSTGSAWALCRTGQPTCLQPLSSPTPGAGTTQWL